MKVIKSSLITQKISEICIEACRVLPNDTTEVIQKSLQSEKDERGRTFLEQYIKNADIAKEKDIPICQDTGTAVFFVEMGDKVKIEGALITEAIAKGVSIGYKDGFLRKSIVNDPLFDRKNTLDNTPPIIHIEPVKGNSLKIKFAPKGGGAENMSALKMLKPSDGENGVIDFVSETVIKAGGNPCPPTIVGIGIGGNFEKSAILAKKALLRKLGESNTDPRYAKLEKKILEKINASGVGPQGLGGDTTSFAVHIEYFPCHIASLPVAVNLNCHASRHKEIIF